METKTHSRNNVIHFSIYVGVGPLSMDRYAEIDDDVDVEQCSDSEAVRSNRQTAQTSLASPSCASDDERSTPEQISVG